MGEFSSVRNAVAQESVTNAEALDELHSDDIFVDLSLEKNEPDQLDHAAIADRLVDVIRLGRTPIHIGLFGSWGSGKSSIYELIRRQIVENQFPIHVVRYDAWKFGGRSLKKNFISEAADQLDLSKYPQFNKGLYQTTQTVEFRGTKLLPQSKLEGIPFWILTGMLVLFLGIGVWSIFWELPAVFQSISGATLGILGATATSGFILNVLFLLIKHSRVNIKQDKPSEDEEFEAALIELNSLALTMKINGRAPLAVLYFIDELDRCHGRDILNTLKDVNNFLGIEGAAFIVAADRIALEKAIAEESATGPVFSNDIYYSTAGEFIDKIFQYQVRIPRKRPVRIRSYAELLVKKRSGIWRQLRSENKDGRLLGAVLYALIPAHVHNPRRVKVLLNSFVLNARIAASRGVDWISEAPALAKLTALQNEFPWFVTALEQYCLLPDWILEAHRGGKVSDDKAEIIAPFLPESVPEETGADDQPDGTESEYVNGPATIVGLDKQQRAVLDVRLRNRLLHYLQSTRRYRIPRHIIFLETPGRAVGVEDPKFIHLLDRDLFNVPEKVVTRLAGESDIDALTAIIKILAEEARAAENYEETLNALYAAIETIRVRIGDLDIATIRRVSGILLETLNRGISLQDRHQAGVISIAVAIEGDEGERLKDHILRGEPPQDGESLSAVIEASVAASSEMRKAIYEFVWTSIANSPYLLVEIIPRTSQETLISFLGRTLIGDNLEAICGHDWPSDEECSAEGVEDALLGALAARNGETNSLAALMLSRLVSKNEASYEGIEEWAEGGARSLPGAWGNAAVIRFLSVAPPGDWEQWLAELDDDKSKRINTSLFAKSMMSMVRRLSAAPTEDIPEMSQIIHKMVGVLPDDAAIEDADQFARDLVQPIPGPALDEAGYVRAHAILQAARAVADLMDGLPINDYLTPKAAQHAPHGQLSLLFAIDCSETFETDIQEQVVGLWNSQVQRPDGQPSAILVLAAAACGGEVSREVASSHVRSAIVERRGLASRILDCWLRERRSVMDLSKVLKSCAPWVIDASRNSIEEHVSQLSPQKGAKLLIALSDGGGKKVVGTVSTALADVDHVAKEILNSVKRGSDVSARRDALMALSHLPAIGTSIRRDVHEYIRESLKSGVKGDLQSILKILPDLPFLKSRAGELRDALGDAMRRHSVTPTRPVRISLQKEGLIPKRKSWLESLLGND